MPNQYPKISLTITVEGDINADYLKAKYTEAVATILCKKIPQNKEFIDELIDRIEKELWTNKNN